ncbi:MAG: glycosyl hydrolase family 28-related protein [Opitutaceae bacterium]
MAFPDPFVRWVALTCLLSGSVLAQSEHVQPPRKDWPDPIEITLTGHPTYFHRHRMEVEGVPWDRQEIYQSSWAGEMGFRISGLGDEPCTLRLEYTEMDMNAPLMRVFDILINDAVVADEVCIFRRVGNRKVLRLDFEATPQDGVIEFSQKKSVPQADAPSFTLLQLYDKEGQLVAERSAWAMRPADWGLNGYLDKIYFGPILDDHDAPPWKATYKIRAHETDRITPADVIGPDGIAYPNWRHVGIPGGIPELAGTHNAADFGAVPGDGIDDSPAIQDAINAVESAGGGVLLIPAGTYHLDRPIRVTADHVVIRGAGAGRTRIVSRFSMRGRSPELRGFNTGDSIGPDTFFYVWADPKGLVQLRIKAGDQVVQKIDRPGLWETQIEFRFPGTTLTGSVQPGPTVLTAEVTYRDGSVRSTTARVVVTDQAIPAARAQGSSG